MDAKDAHEVELMDRSQFTERAERVIELAQALAIYRGEHIACSDLLLAILEEGESSAVQALHNLGFDRNRLRLAIERELTAIVHQYKSPPETIPTV